MARTNDSIFVVISDTDFSTKRYADVIFRADNADIAKHAKTHVGTWAQRMLEFAQSQRQSGKNYWANYRVSFDNGETWALVSESRDALLKSHSGKLATTGTNPLVVNDGSLDALKRMFAKIEKRKTDAMAIVAECDAQLTDIANKIIVAQKDALIDTHNAKRAVFAQSVSFLSAKLLKSALAEWDTVNVAPIA